MSGQTIASAHTEVTGTFLNEDLIGGINADTLVGGAGADTFRLGHDRRPDTIVDFTLGSDRIDLSEAGIRDFTQLTVVDHHSGRVILYYGRDRVMLDDGARGLKASDLSASDFVFDTSTALNTITGTGGTDRIQGTEGNDEIHDGRGYDHLVGHGGGDVFVLEVDGSYEAIRDFTQGDDQIDLTTTGLMDLQDLTMWDHRSGKIVVTYEVAGVEEGIMLMNADRSLRAADVTADDFIFV